MVGTTQHEVLFINDMSVKYAADNVEKSKDKISLKGNAKLIFEDESIETNEISVIFKRGNAIFKR